MVFNSRLGQKIKKGLKLGAKIGAGVLAVGGVLALSKKHSRTTSI